MLPRADRWEVGGTFQNAFRDYDRAVGRYVESDPLGLMGGSYSTYAYGNGDPISKKDPLGLDPWGGLNGGVTPQEAEALSIEQAFSEWWNTPNRCMVKRLGKKAPVVRFFSLASLLPGPWNLSGDAGETVVEDTLGPASKAAGIKGAQYAVYDTSPAAAAWIGGLGKALGYAGLGLTAWATYENIHAYTGSGSSDCGCSQ